MIQLSLKSATYLLPLILIAGGLWGQALQDELTGLPSRPQLPQENQLKQKKAATSLSIPFFDDFSRDSHRPNPNLWQDDHVLISQTMPASPPTLGAAVFDGLDRFGLPYDITRLGTDTTDVLTSQPINLSNPNDSVYLSFFWQAAGNGESPQSNDSIQLQFYDPTLNEWFHVWSESGRDSSEFIPEMIPVDFSLFQDSFQFRFRSFGAPAGGFDTWLIDYVYLADRRNRSDTTFFKTDISFTRPHPSLLINYEAIPWFHYDNANASAYNKEQIDHYYIRNFGPTGTLNPSLGVYKIFLGTDTLAKDNQGSQGYDPVKANFVETEFTHPLKDFIPATIPNQEFTIEAIETYKGTAIAQLSANDTVHRKQVFSNYYAYDDGTAERAYQVPGNDDGVIVTNYQLRSADDSIKGLYLYFFPAEFDATKNQFKIVIFNEASNGRPGNLIYESDSVYTPQYSQSNYYLPYALDQAVKVNQTSIYVGIRQMQSTALPIGFDRNNRGRSTIFYGNDAVQLIESFREGTLMIRPYLRYQPADLENGEIEAPQKIQAGVYPNPARDQITVDLPEANENLTYQLMDINGQLMQQGQVSREIHFNSNIQTGIYLLRIRDVSGQKSPMTTKIVVNR